MARHVIEITGTQAEILQKGADLEACPGALHRSTDTDQVWIGTSNGGLIGPLLTQLAAIQIFGPFPNDDAAGAGGVTVGQLYSLTNENDYGLPEGMLRTRVE